MNLKSLFSRLDRGQALTLAGIFLVGISFLAGTMVGNKPHAAPADNSADAGFARDMIIHHNQAVEMSFIIRGNTENIPIRQLAFDIIHTQAVQSGMMSGWLQQWNLPQTSSRLPMEWAGHEHHEDMEASGKMPGVAGPEEISKLQKLTGNEAEVFYLELMIEHHEGGILMAKSALQLAKDSSARQLAQSIVDSQQAEITLMRTMLKERTAKQQASTGQPLAYLL